MKHTPGPWNVQKTSDGRYTVVKELELIARVGPWTPDVELADAHLIAVAPEMLELLQDIEGYGVPRFNQRIRALIRKADGQ